jgi:hypothetical protein
MAKKVVYTDDLDDTETADAGTVSFAWDGVTYEVDLSIKNKAKYGAQLGPLIAAARAVNTTKRKGKATAPAPSGYSPDQLKAIREWAGRHGYAVSDRGRVPQEILKAFEDYQALNQQPQFSAV